MPRGSQGTREAVARRLGWPDERIELLRLGAVLHDVGKVNIRPEVLGKPGSLDDAELAEVRAHPVEGAWLLAGIGSLGARTALRPLPSRALGRRRLSHAPGRSRHTRRGTAPRRRRRIRRDDIGPSVSSRDRVRQRGGGGGALCRNAIRPGYRGRVLAGVCGGRDHRTRNHCPSPSDVYSRRRFRAGAISGREELAERRISR